MGILAALLTIIMVVTLVAVPQSQMGTVNIRTVMNTRNGLVLFQAARAGLTEALNNRFQPDTNFLNYASGSPIPFFGTSGSIYTDLDENNTPKVDDRIAMYQYMMVGGHRGRDASGSYVDGRNVSSNIVEPAYLIVKSTVCIDGSGNPTAGQISADKVTTFAPTCAVGFTPNSLALVAEVDMETAPNDIVDMQWYSDISNIALGNTTFVPGIGETNSFNFDTAWDDAAKGATALNDKSIDLQRVVFRNGATSNAFTYTQTVAGLDATGTTVSDNPTIALMFNGGLDMRTVYPNYGNTAVDQTISPNHIVKVYDGLGNSKDINAFVSYSRDNQIIISSINSDITTYTHTGSPVGNTPEGLSWPDSDDEYLLAIPASTMKDWFGNTDNLAIQIYFKVGGGGSSYSTGFYDTLGNTGTCANAVVHINGTSTTTNGTGDTNCDNEAFFFNQDALLNTVNAGSGDDHCYYDHYNNDCNGEDGDDTAYLGGIGGFNGGNGTDTFVIGYPSDDNTVVFVDKYGNCANPSGWRTVQVERFDVKTAGDPCPACSSQADYDDLKLLLHTHQWHLVDRRYGIPEYRAGARNSINANVENIQFTDTTKTFAQVCASAIPKFTWLGGSGTLTITEDRTVTHPTSGDDNTIIWDPTYDEVVVIGYSGNDTLQIIGSSTDAVDTYVDHECRITMSGGNYVRIEEDVENIYFTGDAQTWTYNSLASCPDV